MEDTARRLTMEPPDDYDALMKTDMLSLSDKQQTLGIVDNGFQDRDDMVQRIILTQRKLQKISFNPYEKFADGKSDTDSKCDSLKDILQMLHATFSKIPTGPLSDVLVEEGLLKHPDLLDEIQARIEALKDREPLVIVAGETNGGKSTLMNLILGEKILPTDVLHCTTTITKIKYSERYSIETLDRSGARETHSFEGCQDASVKLKEFVAEEDQKSRLKESKYQEITLRMPSEILKSGVTLVDTPGIGEMDEMDHVTMTYIKSTRASGFIYVIKSDTAGGVQEDRLVSFLRAIQEDSLAKKDIMVERGVDPRAALFVCNRWDEISQDGEEIVKKHTLTKLDIVWPGFQKDQVHFFSSKKTQLHLNADPEFVTGKLNDLLLGINKLFNRTSRNTIQHQYRWMKHSIQPASSHIRAMINHCIYSNEELEELSQSVVDKQAFLMEKSKERSPLLMDTLVRFKARLKSDIRHIFSDVQVNKIEDFRQLTHIITEKVLRDSDNKARADEWMMHSLVRYCDDRIHESGILEELETEAKRMIETHTGLFQDQIKMITKLVKGANNNNHHNNNNNNLPFVYASSANSIRSFSSSTSDRPYHHGGTTPGTPTTTTTTTTTMGPTELTKAINNLLGKKAKARGRLLPSAKRKMMATVQTGAEALGKNFGKSSRDIPAYVEKRIQKHANTIKDSSDVIEGFAVRYLLLIEKYVKSAVEHIPHFIGVNNKLMEKIRDHHTALQDNKEKMKQVMDELEPHRERLRGYGLLFMEDVNADNVEFNTDRRHVNIQINRQSLEVPTLSRDSGFHDSDKRSARDCVRGFWTLMRNADINVDEKPLEVAVKTYTTPLDTGIQLSEIASLRYLDHKNLAPFFGMTRIALTSDETTYNTAPEKITAFIFEGSLVSARVFKSNKHLVQKNFLKRFVHELLSGLEYIHRENMVHLELNLDTVMVNYHTGAVQLCQQCKPRKIALPTDLSVLTNSSVCLSPSVLQGKSQYEVTDDIYAFVILVWELLFPSNLPYAEQRQWPLDRFIQNVSPHQMLGPEIKNLDAPVAVIGIFKDVLLTGEGGAYCSTTRDIKSIEEDLNKDPRLNMTKTERPRSTNRWSREVFSAQVEDPEIESHLTLHRKLCQSTPNLFNHLNKSFKNISKSCGTTGKTKEILMKFEKLHLDRNQNFSKDKKERRDAKDDNVETRKGYHKSSSRDPSEDDFASPTAALPTFSTEYETLSYNNNADESDSGERDTHAFSKAHPILASDDTFLTTASLHSISMHQFNSASSPCMNDFESDLGFTVSNSNALPVFMATDLQTDCESAQSMAFGGSALPEIFVEDLSFAQTNSKAS